jgi:hypothetical protein
MKGKAHSWGSNVNAEVKSEVEMQTSVDATRKLPPSPRWSPSQGSPRKGQAPGQVTPWIALDLPQAQVGLRCAFRQASPGPLPAVFTIKLSVKTLQALFPPVHGGGHTTNVVGVVSQDYKPCRVQQWCTQASSGKRYANLTKH